jgi:DNA-binding transcriptional ArsR family regulator
MAVEPWPAHDGAMAVARTPVAPGGGEVDIAAVATLFADRTRARVLTALADGRALPASTLAAEAGVSPQAASAQLARLTRAGLVTGERSGRHRFYRLASDRVAAILEALAAAAPVQPVRSLRQGTRAAALRRARTCYDHLAGQLGCQVTGALVDAGALVTTDGVDGTGRRAGERLSAPLATHPYRLGPRAREVLCGLGVDAAVLDGPATGRRPLLRFCLDWTEQRHHLAGALGAALLTAVEDAGWVARRPRDRALRVTPLGRDQLRDALGVVLDPAA